MKKTLETKIKYLLAGDEKVYKVTHTDFSNLTIEASETNLSVSDIPPDELFCLTDFREFKIRLRNWKGNIVKFPGIESQKGQ